MVDAVQLRPAAPDAVVRPLTRAAERPCARPGCPAPARATLTFRYASREAWLARLADEPDPQAYDLCVPHASRTRPPQGWDLRDRRPEEEREPDVPPTTPADLGGERTVAVLAAALRQAPDPTPARGVRGRAAEVVPDPLNELPSLVDDVPRPRGVFPPAEREVTEDAPSPVLGPTDPSADRPPDPAPRPVLAARRPGRLTPPPGDGPAPTAAPAADW